MFSAWLFIEECKTNVNKKIDGLMAADYKGESPGRSGIHQLPERPPMQPIKIVSWFSCGAASAVSTKLLLAKAAKLLKPVDVKIVRIAIPEESEDNDRFAADCARWFGQEIEVIQSAEYAGAEDVWERRRFMSGPHGAPCTTILKRDVRKAFENRWSPDLQVFGYTSEEKDRADKFRHDHPEIGLVCNLIDAGLTKDDCFGMLARAGIELPLRYRQGFRNNNCKGCVKASSVDYWQRTRKYDPETFQRRADLSRELGVKLVRLGDGERERLHLDDLPLGEPGNDEPDLDCSLMCVIAESEIST